MPEQRIVLANGSRLLRDMLKRVLFKSDRLDIVREVTEQKELTSVIESMNPHWVIISLSFDNVIPPWVDSFMVTHPTVRFMGFANDGSKVKMKWLEVHEQDFDELSLNELIHILESKPVDA